MANETSIPPYHNPILKSGEWKWWITDAGRVNLRQNVSSGLSPIVNRYINTQSVTVDKTGDILVCTNYFSGYVKKNGKRLISIQQAQVASPLASGNFLAYVVQVVPGDIISLSAAPAVNTIIEITWMAFTGDGIAEQRVQLPPAPEYDNPDPRWYGYWIDCYKKLRVLEQSDIVQKYTSVTEDSQTYAALALVNGVAQDVADVTVTAAGRVAFVISIWLLGNADADVDFDLDDGSGSIATITIPTNGTEPKCDMAFRAYHTATGAKTYTLKATAGGADVGGYLKVRLIAAA